MGKIVYVLFTGFRVIPVDKGPDSTLKCPNLN